MSDFTTQLRFICESYAGRTKEGSEAKDVDSIIALARPQLFNFDYPIFDEAYRPELETKIINHFYTQEIGQETVGLFKQRLKTKMREIMPYYNQFYLSERMKFDPFKNADYVDLHNQSAEGTSRITNNNTSDFNNTTARDISNTHEDESTTTYEAEGTSRNTNVRDMDGTSKVNVSSSDERTGEVTTKETDSSTLTKSGTEKSELNFDGRKDNNLHKEADTPIGNIGDVSGSDGDALAGNSGYLSKVTQDINKKTGKETNETSFTNRKDSTSGTKNVTTNSSEEGSATSLTTGTTTEDTTTTDNGGTTDNSTTHVISDGTYKTDDDTVASGLSHSNTTDNRNTTDKQDYFGKVFGKVGSETYSEMLNKFRSTFMNIDMDVIHELEPLFMLVW